MKKIIRITESDLHSMIADAIQKIILENIENEGFGVNRPKNATKGMAKSLMGKNDPWREFYPANDKNSDAAREHGNGGQFGKQRRVGDKRAVSTYDPLELRQEMNKLGNDPQDTLRKSLEYGHLANGNTPVKFELRKLEKQLANATNEQQKNSLMRQIANIKRMHNIQ